MKWSSNPKYSLPYILFFCTLFKTSAFAGRIDVYPLNKNLEIKEAIAKAINGDSIFIHSGLYRENNILITKSIHLIGVGNPVIDGEHNNVTITISGRNITLSGITIQNSGHSAMNDIAGIRCIDASDIHIIQNKVLNCHFGIHVSNSEDILIQNNEVVGTPGAEQNTGNGIHLWKCNRAKIFSNYITGHRDGIYFEFVTHSIIQDNKSYTNIRYGLHFMFSHNDQYLCNEFRENGAGVAVMYSKNVTMEENLFYKNWGASAYGILLKDITDSKIEKNHFFENTVGIHFEGTSRLKILRNEFISNGWAMKVQASCSENHFNNNNFLANSFDVATNGSLVLNTFTNNYWDKYEGYDLNKDGIGDIPYYPVSLYSIIVEQFPGTMILLRSILINFLDKAEKAIPSLTPENLKDFQPRINKNTL
ncbi:MAG: nitrous oxide reductase family maturation protein NosD [Saprospiraceae bacterium]|nr:nitrous oxide reductase family maturation protein NosD [Saprospiraceae bacterium]